MEKKLSQSSLTHQAQAPAPARASNANAAKVSFDHDGSIIWFGKDSQKKENAAIKDDIDKAFSQSYYTDSMEEMKKFKEYAKGKENAKEEKKEGKEKKEGEGEGKKLQEIWNAIPPIFFITNKDDYESVKSNIDDCPEVSAIFIICPNEESQVDLRKVDKAVPILKYSELIGAINATEMKSKDHLSRFFKERTERTFYDLSDRNTIVDSLLMANKGENFSVFYPLGTKSTRLSDDLLTRKILNEIRFVANADLCLTSFRKKIFDALGFIEINVVDAVKEEKIKEYEFNKNIHGKVLYSYTIEKVYYMLNLYLRYGNETGFSLFKQYMYCLKACICELGRPVIEEKTTVYRGMGINKQFLDKYIANKGKIVLLNAFTSTTTTKQIAMDFARKGKGKQVLYEIEMVKFDEEFENYILDFKFPEENGVFFPADISKFSKYKQEKEVLFPPFYPIRIIEVREKNEKRKKVKEGKKEEKKEKMTIRQKLAKKKEVKPLGNRTYWKIYAETPRSVSVAGKDFCTNLLKGSSGDTNADITLLESILDLIERGAIDKLSIVKRNLKENEVIQKKIIQTLSKEQVLVSKIVIEREELTELDKLLTVVASTNGLKRLSLRTILHQAYRVKRIRQKGRKSHK